MKSLGAAREGRAKSMSSKKFSGSTDRDGSRAEPIPTRRISHPEDRLASLTLALIVVCVAALASASTRGIGVLALALLVVLHPLLTCLGALTALGIHLFIQSRKK